MDSMKISMRSGTTIQHSVTSPSAVLEHSSVNQQVMDQFAQMKTMLSLFLGPRQETTGTAFCNYLVSELEALRGYFQTFRNEAVKLISSIKSRADERSHQPQHPQQQTLSGSSCATLTFVPQTFQQPQQPAPAAREYILTIPKTQMPASQVIQPTQQSQVATKGQQQPRGQLVSFVVVYDQQAGPSRPFTFTLTPMEHLSPLSVASATDKESQHNK